MKKLVLAMLLTLCTNVFSQVTESWNPICTTYVPTIAGERIALFANHSGIHLLQSVHVTGGSSNTVKYYRLKSTGEIDDNFPSAGISLDSYGDFPNLTGDEENLFAVYQKGGTILAKKSTDGGNNWLSEASKQFENSSTESNGVDAAYTVEKGLHIVWSQKEGTLYESYFARWYNGQWLNNTQITNHTNLPTGGFPTVAL